jgi:L-aspartate oxidase
VKRLLIPESYFALQPHVTNSLGEQFLEAHLPAAVSVAQCLHQRAGTGPFRSDSPGRHFDLAVCSEVRQGRGTPSGGVRVDFTRCDPAAVRSGRLNWYDWARSRGVDLLVRPVEVSPHVHAINGGLLIDAQAESNVPQLFACGEAISGPHGANRIGGNQFSGGQVFGARAGRYAAERASQIGPAELGGDAASVCDEVTRRVERLREAPAGRAPSEVLAALQSTMWNEMGITKDAASLERCLRNLDELETDAVQVVAPDPRELFLALSLPGLVRTAQAMARAALIRAESRGPHYRSDHPSPNPDFDDGSIHIRARAGGLVFRREALR